MVAPLDHNCLQYQHQQPTAPLKTTLNSLPFFEDFTGNTPYPDPTKWLDKSVYINNTMGIDVISRGVATFDALNANSIPYDPTNPYALLYADSLTSIPFDLSTYLPSDSLYLSFFYQPQGNGFAPEAQDSFMLFFKASNGSWRRIWAVPGTPLQPFEQVMIAVTDTTYFHSNFQFRFINKASININDDVWNLDYIRFDANRNPADTLVKDIATTLPPSPILNDYTSLPYRQFAADMNKELRTQHAFTAHNRYSTLQAVTSGYQAREVSTGTPLAAVPGSSGNLPPYTAQTYSFPVYPISFTPSNNYSKVIFENTYYAGIAASENKINDTVVHQQVFDNYLAYDDGTAEKSYFIKQTATLPAKLAIEYHLNQPDTLRGFAIYFGRQVPIATSKFFTVNVFKDIAFNGGSDVKLYEQQLYFTAYTDEVNKFWYYKFNDPIPLSAGSFYLSIIQPAFSGSDSLYYGLDVNRVGSNHAYYSVYNKWESSTVSGAIMLRPLIGNDFIASAIKDVSAIEKPYILYPNPVSRQLYLQSQQPMGTMVHYEIIDLQGRVLRKGKYHKSISAEGLTTGVYFIRIFDGTEATTTLRFVKE